jgi:hypothetical protein
MQPEIARPMPVKVDPLKERQKWIAFSERILACCIEIHKASDVAITEKLFAEPQVLALALLSRSYVTLKGVIALAKEGLAVEARILTRSCFENLFLVAGLIEKGTAFVEEMFNDDARSTLSRGEFVLEDSTGTAMEKKLRQNLDRLKADRPKAKLLNPKTMLKDSVLRKAYLFYSQLSADAAHPSITALKRHVLRIQEDGGWVLGLDMHPAERGAEVADTINMACNAVLGTCVSVNQILGYTTASPLVKELFEAYEIDNPAKGAASYPV